MTFTELEAMEKVTTEIYNRGFEDGKKMEYKDFKFSEMQNKNKVKILDKIRAEIDEQYDNVHPYNLSCAEGLEMALGIIDKYNAESEKKEEISKDDAIKIVHDTIHDFFVDSETFNDKDKLLLKINKAICNNIMGY